MKEILKNKAVVGLFILMLGFVYLKSMPNTTLTDTFDQKEETIVYKNN